MKMDKNKVVAQARLAAETLMLLRDIRFEGGCVYYAAVLRSVLIAEYGVPPRHALIQAGSMSWPRLNADQDDGKETTMTHFSYQFEPTSPATINALVNGAMPELHAWVACFNRDDKQWHLVDVTTKYLVQRCAEIGLDWPGDPPPDYLWRPVTDPPPRTVYRPHMAATNIVAAAVTDIMGSFAPQRRAF